MRDVKFDLHSEYFRLLNGNVVVDKEVYPAPVRPSEDVVVPIYDSVPVSATYPYVKLGEWTDNDWSDKTAFGSELTFQVQIVDRYEGAMAPRGVIYKVLNEVKQIIRARPVPFDIFGWNIISSVVDAESSLYESDETHTYVYFNLTFRHQSEQIELLNTFDNTFDNTFS